MLVAISIAANGLACGRAPRLSHTLESPEAVASAVLTGLQRRDVEGLRVLALAEDEFRGLVWPRLPASRPERNIPWDYVWKDLSSKSRLQLAARLNEFRDRGYGVVSVRFTGETTDYETFRVFRASAVTLRDRDGRETTQRLFGSMVEQNGRYKVFSYVVD
jgi:hypothetical protein